MTWNRRGKFNAVRTEVDGVKFASKKEAARFSELALLNKAGEISDLKLQPRFPCVVNGIKVCTYVADFEYINLDGEVIVEDSKGFKTPMYRLKKKLFEAIYYPLTITES